MKITIYELLGMVKDGKAPKKIKITGNIYEYDSLLEWYYTRKNGFRVMLGGVDNEINLIANAFNEKLVEILEKEKKIPKKIEIDNEDRIQALSTGNFVYKVSQPTKNIIYKINEVIDYLDYLKNKGDE